MKTVYPLAAEAALTALCPDTVTLVALDATYVYSATDQYESDLIGQLGTPLALAGVAFTGGVLTCTLPLAYAGLSPGDVVTAIALYNDTGVAVTSVLLGVTFEDSSGAAINYTSDGSTWAISFPGINLLSV